MANELSLKKSESLRMELDEEQQKLISKLYSDVLKDLKKTTKKLEGKDNISSVLRMQYLAQMEKELNLALVESEKAIGTKIVQDLEKMSQAVTDDMDAWSKSLGIPSGGALLNVPKDIVEKIVAGGIYEGIWSLSSALWKDVAKKQQEIQTIVAQGVAVNKSAYEIAKDLEKYVDPKATKESRKIQYVDKEGRKKTFYFGKVDYNAQRLARTLVSHAYQQSLIDATRNNPFVKGLKWRSALISSRTCQLCKDRHGKVFNKDELPLDHPNGLCTFLAVVDDLDDIGERLANWANGGSDPELDKYSAIISGTKV